MTNQFIQTYIGVHPADAEQVEISFANGNLVLRYIDMNDLKQETTLYETIAFRWNEIGESDTPRDDTTYKVVNSPWLARQIIGVSNPSAFAHYKLCFNACGELDVICKEIKITNSAPSQDG